MKKKSNWDLCVEELGKKLKQNQSMFALESIGLRAAIRIVQKHQKNEKSPTHPKP